MTPMVWLAAAASASAVWLVARLVTPPPRRLRGRLDPYVSPTISTLGGPNGSGPLKSVFGPMLRDLADWVGTKVDRTGGGVTVSRLRQSGWFTGISEEQMLASYRMTQLKSLAFAVLLGIAAGHLLHASLVVRALLIALGFVVGITRTRGRLESAIENRRARMRIEVYTVNQLLAMRVRAGGGVIQAVSATVARGSGEVVSELEEVLRLHRAGWRGPDAFRRIAELTPEPFCARTYRLLANAEERGADLAGALLSLSEDVRETRREAIKRTATKRRAAMLIPTIAILAPVLMLFVAAPLPYLITGWQ